MDKIKDMRCFDMQKRVSKKGQATTFVIVGIVIIVAAVLVWYLRTQYIFGPITPETLEQKGMDPIRDHVRWCIGEVAPEYLDRIGLQGGYLKTPVDTFRKNMDIPVSYLCYNMEGVPTCYNRYLTRSHMEGELSKAIKEGLGTCLNIKKFARGFDVNMGGLNVGVDIGDYETIVTAFIPVTVKKNDIVIEEDEFDVGFDIPLGALYDVSMEIVNTESQIGEFEQLSYMLVHKGQFIIDKKKPYPDKFYILKTKDSDYKFQFFVQGEEL